MRLQARGARPGPRAIRQDVSGPQVSFLRFRLGFAFVFPTASQLLAVGNTGEIRQGTKLIDQVSIDDALALRNGAREEDSE